MSVLRRWAEAALGVPLTAAGRDADYSRLTAGLDDHAALQRVSGAVTHITEKAGALLAAQGMFLVVAIFAVDRGWPRGFCVPAVLLLLGAALIVTSTLRSTSAVRDPKDPRPIARKGMDLVHRRIVRFNLGLYLTFASICLLGVSAIGTL